MMLKQQQDQLEIEEAHTKEYETFQIQWDQKLREKEDEHAQQSGQLEDTHTKQLEENRASLEEKLPQEPKASSELLNLRRIQDQLARQREYADAHQIQLKAQELEKQEMDKHIQLRQKKMVSAEAKLIQQQQNQMHALRKKQDNLIREMTRLREREHEQMLQRYQNVKKELESQQNLDRVRLENTFGKQMQAHQTVGSKQKEVATVGMGSTKGFQSTKSKQSASPDSRHR